MILEDRYMDELGLLNILRIKLEHDVPLTTEEAAVLRGCAPDTLTRERVRGGDTAPFVRIGRGVRYPARRFLAWLRDRPTSEHTSETAGVPPSNVREKAAQVPRPRRGARGT